MKKIVALFFALMLLTASTSALAAGMPVNQSQNALQLLR